MITIDNATSGYIAVVIHCSTSAALGASCFQYVAPRVLGMISESTRISSVSTTEVAVR